jgi:DNA-3-methyladenine glycosylase II
MGGFIHSEDDLDAAIAALIAGDARFGDILAIAGRPPLRRRPEGFAGLVAIVVAQQLSTASAGAILARLTARLDPLDAAAMQRARTDTLRRIGLSAPKIRTLKTIARAIGNGALDLNALSRLPADDAHAALVAVHGIGPWTADIYLLSCLGHADAWPGGDLALQEAARRAFALRQRPGTKDMAAIAEPWRPWRAVAARMLWTYYRAVKGREGAPIQPVASIQSKKGTRRP